MKNLRLLMPVFALFFLFSCNKSGSSASASNSITATVNGAAETFNASASATTVGGALTITGLQNETANTTIVGLVITNSNGKTVTAGTYTGSANNTGSQQVQLTYELTGSSTVYQNDGSANDNTVVTITSVSSSQVQGTFSGTLPLQLGSGATTTAITNGKFNLTIK